MSNKPNIPNIPNQKNYKNLTAFDLALIQRFPFIEEDFDGMNLYGILSKIKDNLNQVIANEQIVTENQENLYNSFVDLHNYVEDYFTNLDVQEEINNKLDEMAENGTLTQLIKNYIDPIYQEYESRIDNNIQQQNQNISVLESRMDGFTNLPNGSTSGDAELNDIRTAYNGALFRNAGDSVRGQANLINQTKETVIPILFNKKSISWINDKRITNTGNIENAEGFKISEPIKIESKTLLYDYIYTFGSNLTFSYMFNFYNSNVITQANRVGYANPSNAQASIKCYANMSGINTPENAVYLVISCISSQLLSLNLYDTIFNTNLIKNNNIDYNKLKDLFYGENILDGLSSPGTIANDGNISSSSTYKITDFIQVDDLTKYYRLNTQAVCLVGCYDENKNWIERLDVRANSTNFTTPENCKFIKYCDANNSMQNQVIGKYQVPDFIPYNTTEQLIINYSEFANAIINKINIKKLKNKNVCILGDSIAYGIGASDRNETSWVSLLRKNTGANITNLAISGSSLQYRENAESIAKSMYTVSTETDFSNFDIVIISCGTNDILGNIGQPNDNINTTACGALNLIIENILSSNPYCQIIYFGPMFRARFDQGDGHNSDDYSYQGKWVSDLAEKLQQTAHKNHVPAKNLYTDFMLNKYNSSILLTDGLHPNDLGYLRLYKCINDFIDINI